MDLSGSPVRIENGTFGTLLIAPNASVTLVGGTYACINYWTAIRS